LQLGRESSRVANKSASPQQHNKTHNHAHCNSHVWPPNTKYALCDTVQSRRGEHTVRTQTTVTTDAPASEAACKIGHSIEFLSRPNLCEGTCQTNKQHPCGPGRDLRGAASPAADPPPPPPVPEAKPTCPHPQFRPTCLAKANKPWPSTKANKPWPEVAADYGARLEWNLTQHYENCSHTNL
jgi:hypothetical protein